MSFFESLTPADLPRLAEIYASTAHFKDPFNEVQGVAAIQQVFEHMFVALDKPGFVVHDIVQQADAFFITWHFNFRFKRGDGSPQTVRGCSHFQLDAQGLVSLHRDYWDAAEELYEKLPLLGTLMRYVKRRARS